MSAPPSSLPQPDDPDFLTVIGGLYKASRMLFTAHNVGLFTALADGPLGLEELAAATKLPPQSVHVLAHAMLTLRVLEQRDGRFANGRAAQEGLARPGADPMRAALRLYEQVNYPLWDQFEQTIRTGAPARTSKPSPEFGRIFSEGVEAFTRPAAEALPKVYDFSRHQRVLDIAGGTGSYLLPILGQHAEIAATLYELPSAADVARRRLAADPLGGRVRIVEGDALFDPLPPGYDVVLLANTIHLFGPEKVQRLFARIREAVAPGARLVMPDYWVDPSHTHPLYAALVSGTFLLLSGEGRSYSAEEAGEWLSSSGWRMLEHSPLLGSISLVVAEAT